MKKTNHYYFTRRLFIMLLILLAVIVAVFSSGCEVLKAKRSLKVDSVAISRVDSGRVVKTDAGNKNDSTWWREIINYIPNGRDTVINNTTVPVNNYYPAQIIREGGTLIKSDWLRMIDSVNKIKSDTTAVNKTDEAKSKETKTPGWMKALIIFGYIFCILGVTLFIIIIYKKFIS